MKMQKPNNNSMPTALAIVLMVGLLIGSRLMFPQTSQPQGENATGSQVETNIDFQEKADADSQVKNNDVSQKETEAESVEPKEDSADQVEDKEQIEDNDQANTDSENERELSFRNNKLLSNHYEKHGKDMGFESKEEYEKAAAKVVNNPEALHKIEAEDGDDVYYVESTNEFVVVSKDGYIRTYFLPDAGKKYYDRQ